MAKQKDELTRDKVKIYDLLTNIFLRIILTICSIVAFFIVLYYLISAQSTFEAVKFGLIEIFLGSTVFLVWRYYFKVK